MMRLPLFCVNLIKKEKPDISSFSDVGASVHNGFMKNSGFISSYTHFSLAHL